MPFLQRQAPAELAADAVLQALNSLEDIDSADYTIVDFCSGAGGRISGTPTESEVAAMLTPGSRPDTLH